MYKLQLPDPPPAVVGRTRPDVAEVVAELLKRSPEWNRRLAAEIREAFSSRTA